VNTFIEAMASFGLNLAIVIIIVRFIYYPQQRDKNYVFTLITFNTIVFFVMGLLNNANIGVGVGFGLFAIFSILRYRTDTIPIREMTYLFVLIALPVLNSVLLTSAVYAEFAVVNLATIAILFVLEKGWGFQYEARKTIVYERIELVRPENWSLMLDDLRARTGLPIKRVEIGRLNFLRDSAEITIFYEARSLQTAMVGFSVEPVSVSEDE
jgi:hypothetical protein